MSDEDRQVHWETPRFRDPDEQQRDVERDHRLHGDNAPAERGAIDRDGSVGDRPKRGKRPARRPAGGGSTA